MTAATVTSEFPHKQAEERVVLTATDGETFVSKLSTVEMVQMTSAEDMGSETNSWSYTISGRTVTMYADGVTDKLVALTLYGKL